MTRIVRALAIAIAVALAVGSLPARAEEARPNWLAVKVVTGPDAAAYVRVGVHVKVQGDGTGPILRGFANAAYEPRLQVARVGREPLAITTTSELGSTSITIVPQSDGAFEMWISSYRYLYRDEVDLTAFFVANASYTLLEHTTTVLDGSATVSATQGSGADDITMAAPGDHGVAVGVGSDALGLSTHSASPEAGIVGAVEGSWDAPDGRHGHDVFAGPAGDWSWTTLGWAEPWVGAYAPIGEDWVLLR